MCLKCCPYTVKHIRSLTSRWSSCYNEVEGSAKSGMQDRFMSFFSKKNCQTIKMNKSSVGNPHSVSICYLTFYLVVVYVPKCEQDDDDKLSLIRRTDTCVCEFFKLLQNRYYAVNADARSSWARRVSGIFGFRLYDFKNLLNSAAARCCGTLFTCSH